MNDFLKRNLPPGTDPRTLATLFCVGNALAIFVSLFGFFMNYLSARNELYEIVDGHYLLIDGSVIAPFLTMTGAFRTVFSVLALTILSFIVQHALSYRRGSMSIYLMKRLPKRSERHRRVLLLPVLFAAATVVTALVLYLTLFAVYRFATPRECLPDDVIRELWRIF